MEITGRMNSMPEFAGRECSTHQVLHQVVSLELLLLPSFGASNNQIQLKTGTAIEPSTASSERHVW